VVSALEEHLPESLTHWPGYLLTFIAEQATERFETQIEPYGIRAKHAQVLLVIDAEGPMSQRALGRRLRIDKSPMVGVLDDLEQLGLAERRRSDSDRRVQAIHLTRAGRNALARVLEIAEAENARTFEPLDAAEREVLHDLLLRGAEASAAPTR
jgi:MarR family transcriptional regulator, lower aerobic nicotinate degradation pathway regulator